MINNNNEARVLVDQLKSRRQGLIEARKNEINPIDRAPIIKEIEFVNDELRRYSCLVFNGAD